MTLVPSAFFIACASTTGSADATFVPTDAANEPPGAYGIVEAIGSNYPTPNTLLHARFVTRIQSPGGCVPLGTSDQCTLFECGSSAPLEQTHSAGPVMISGGGIPAGEQLSPTATGDYPDEFLPLVPWSPGDAIRFSAPGQADGIPAFDLTFIGPPDLRVSSPLLAVGARLERSAGARFEWLPVASNARLRVMVDSDPGSRYVDCAFDLSRGVGIASPQIVSMLATGSAFVFVSVEETREVQVGAFDLRFTVAIPIHGDALQHLIGIE